MSVQVNAKSEQVVVEILSTFFDDVGFIDPETVSGNIELGCEGGMSKADRSIKSDLANYLIKNFSLIFIGLISNKSLRGDFKDAVSVEIGLDHQPEPVVKRMRQEMRDGVPSANKSVYVINFGKENAVVYEKILNMLADSIYLVKSYEAAVSELISELNDDDRIEIGFCISNFMYLIRAFSKNQAFCNYVKDVVDNVRTSLKIA